MTGGRLQFDVLAAGSVVPAFQMQDAVHAGILDGGHGVCDIWYRKHKAASLFGSPPPFGWDAHGMLAWFYAGGGEALYRELVNDILKLNVVGLLYFPMPSQPLGWFKKEIKGVDDLKGISYRSEGIAADLFRALGAAVTILPSGEIMQAMDRGLLDAAALNNPSSDLQLGLPEVAKVYMMGSHHRAAGAFEIIFNKGKHDALPVEIKSILRHAALAASTSQLGIAYTPLSEGSRRDQEARRRCRPHRRSGAAGPACRLGQADRGLFQGSVLRQGDRLAENLGQAHAALSCRQQPWFRRTCGGVSTFPRLVEVGWLGREA